MNKFLLLLLLFYCLILNSCKSLQPQIRDFIGTQDIKSEVESLKKLYAQIQNNQADLNSKIEDFTRLTQSLNERLSQNDLRLSLISQKVDDFNQQVNSKLDLISKEVGNIKKPEPTPSDLFQTAYSDFISGRFDLAKVEFETYLDKYPSGTLGPQALYYLAECYFSKKEWSDALDKYNEFLNNYPESTLKSSARLKIAFCYYYLGKLKEAEAQFKYVSKNFSYLPEGSMAKEYITIIKKTPLQKKATEEFSPTEKKTTEGTTP